MKEVIDTRFLVEHFFATDRKILEGTRAKLRDLRRSGEGIVPAIVLAEFFNLICQRAGGREAAAKCQALVNSGLTVRALSADIALRAGRLRSSHRQIPLADCLIAATAEIEGARVLTDDPHFRQLRTVRVAWV